MTETTKRSEITKISELHDKITEIMKKIVEINKITEMTKSTK